MTEKEANSDALRHGQEVKDGPFVFQIRAVKDIDYYWFKQERKDDELVLYIRNSCRESSVDVLRTLPFCVGKLPAVSGIWFKDGGISDVVASALGELKGVRAVGFGKGSSIRIVPGFLSSLSHDLNRLCISKQIGTSLSDSAGVLPSLTNLKELNLCDCGLKELPANFSHLNQLTLLDLQGNKELKRLPEYICSNMKKLQILDLEGCGLKELPANFSHLTQLTRLNLYGNTELKRLPEDMCLKMKKLKLLDLQKCSLRELPANFGDLTELRSFHCKRNPLIKPPMAVCEQGVDAIRAHFLDLKKAETLKRFKIILLGEACSGKTSLILTMINKKSTCTKEENRTIGVDEYELKLSDGKKAKTLDCGGHRCYLLTNQLFVSENAMIWIVVDINQYQLTKKSFHQQIGQYLQVAYERCRQNQVVIVFSQIDRLPGKFSRWIKSCLGYSMPPECSVYQNHVASQLKVFIQSRETKVKRMEEDGCGNAFTRFQDIKIWDNVIFASANKMETVEMLEQLANALASNKSMFPTVDDVVPAAWIKFEEELVQKSANAHLSILEMSTVNDLGIQHGLQREHIKTVLSYHHQVGTLLYFSHSRLSNVVFGSSRRVVNVLKEVFCDSHHSHEYKKEYAMFYDSLEQFYADKGQLVDNGILTISFFKTLMSSLDLNRESLNVFIIMLFCFDFAYVKGFSCFREWKEDELGLDAANVLCQLEKSDACFFLPWLLKEKRSDGAISKFSLECPSLWAEVDIFFSFALSLPIGIFEQFSARCHRHSDLIQHWTSGFLLEHGPVLAQITCELKDDNPEIHCRSRVPKSMNALLRLFHVLWRCVIDLENLLKTVPGCLYETYLIYKDRTETLEKKEKITITEDWNLQSAGEVNCEVIVRDCKEAAKQVVWSIRKSSLKNAYSHDLGLHVSSSSRYLKDVAIAVGAMEDESRHCNTLARCLYVDWEGETGNVRRMLEKWQKMRGTDAVVAVLSDALQECGLETVKRKCFQGIHDVELSHHEVTGGQTDSSVVFPALALAATSPTQQQLNILSREIAGRWRPLATALSVPSCVCDQIKADYRDQSREQAYEMLIWWKQKNSGRATFRKLQEALRSEDLDDLGRKVLEY